MSRSYRFVRLDPALRPVEQVDLICSNDKDALLLAERVGRRVEVWRDGTRLGLVGSGIAEAAAAMAPRIVPDSAEPAPAGPVAAPVDEADPAPEPIATDPAPSTPRAFNPFRPGAWRRRGPEG